MLAVWLSMYGICNVLGWQMVAELLEVLLQQLVEAIQVGILGVVHSTLFLASQAASFVEPMQLLMRTATAIRTLELWVTVFVGICLLCMMAFQGYKLSRAVTSIKVVLKTIVLLIQFFVHLYT